VKRIVLIVSAFIWITPATLRAGQATLGWPEVIALLTKARTQATTCVEVLKSSGDKAALASARLTYGMAEGDMDGVIRGLTTALIEGGDPDRLPTVRTSLEALGKSLKEICDAAVKTITPNTKGVREEVAKGAVEPLFGAISDGAGELWTRPVEKDKLELETKKSQLEAAKWPKFADIAAAPSPLDQALQKLIAGNVAFNTPENMSVGRSRIIEAKLSVNLPPDILVAQLSEAGKRESASLSVADRMNATLSGGGAFDVSPSGPQQQLISRQKVTTWTWEVSKLEPNI
jgi:hypothetical protein